MDVENAAHSRIKFFQTLPQQVALLKSRGMAIADDQSAQKTLSRIGYYRLSGYFYPLRKTNPRGIVGRQDEFQEGTCLALIEQLYEFDRQLRLLILDAVERVEVAVRFDVAHRLGQRHRRAHQIIDQLDAQFCTKPNHSGKTPYQEWCERLDAVLSKAGKEDFVKHHFQNYGGSMPIWAVTEVWDFGLLSKFFVGMRYKDQSYIAQKYGIQEGRFLASWLRAINFARNVSAHHSRLWNRNFVDRPMFPTLQPHHHLYHLQQDTHAQTRVYGALCLLRTMLKTIAPGNDWATKLINVTQFFPNSALLSLQSAGFPTDWKEYPLWQT